MSEYDLKYGGNSQLLVQKSSDSAVSKDRLGDHVEGH
jgi:hypothetical protein